MHDRIKPLLSELKVGLQRIYHDRLHGVYLYGSYARGEADSDSDVDVGLFNKLSSLRDSKKIVAQVAIQNVVRMGLPVR